MTRRRPASAPLKSHVPYEKYLPDEKHEDLTDGPKGTSFIISIRIQPIKHMKAAQSKNKKQN